MKSLPVRRIYRLAVAALALAGALWSIVAVGFAAQAWWRLPDLSAWHRIALDSEFRAGNDGAAATFAAYLEQEARLFVELKQRIYDDPGQASRQPYDRYAAGSPVARLALESAGNRSGVTEAHAARGAVVLLHGLTDAPYSLHAVGRALHERGLHVVTLRLPGHGTTPGALTRVSWHDWDAAVLLAVRHAAALAGGKPLYVAGYSTGAPLALLHALRAIDDPAVPMPTRLFLFSPAIGVSEFAVMSEFAGTLAFLPGLQKASWLDVLPEYDPFKYNSFPVNAANQVWRLTRELEARLRAAQEAGTLGRMPPITAFQSLVDSTVLAADVGRRLFMRLPARGHELVVFDVNRQELLAVDVEYHELVAARRQAQEQARADVGGEHRRVDQRLERHDRRHPVELARLVGSAQPCLQFARQAPDLVGGVDREGVVLVRVVLGQHVEPARLLQAGHEGQCAGGLRHHRELRHADGRREQQQARRHRNRRIVDGPQRVQQR